MFRQWVVIAALVLPMSAIAAEGGGDYHAVRVSELPRHIGKPVRISLPRGIVREGTLAEANPSTITVERTYGRGGMKFEILSKQVEKAEVQD